MITVKLFGGLGNQMFQYAAARRLAHVLSAGLKLDVSWFRHSRSRRYELSVFNIRESFASFFETPKDNGFIGSIQRLFGQNLRHVRERHYRFDPEILALPDNVYLDGYWQSEKYFRDIEEIIRSDFTLKTAPSHENAALAHAIGTTKSASIHIRRGDYVSDPQIHRYHGVCPPEYYSACIEELRRRAGRNLAFFIFSDDPLWARESFTVDGPAEVVDINGMEKCAEDLRLMSLCRYHIIANRSFSWWGAWLCGHRDKIVLAPKKWFGEAPLDTSDLIPGEWITV